MAWIKAQTFPNGRGQAVTTSFEPNAFEAVLNRATLSEGSRDPAGDAHFQNVLDVD